MSERKAWSQQEDQALKYFYEAQGVRKWSQISKLMMQQFGLNGRNGKQCRERYHNHLDSRITKESWKVEEERKLVDLHNKIGNRWAMIAREIPGRTDNCVKNHFYSKIRKAIRKLNKNISEYFRRQFKQLKVQMVYKIIEIAQERYKNSYKGYSEIQLTCYEIKNKILEHSFDQQNQTPMTRQQILEAKQLIAQVAEISKKTKAKNKKKKNKKRDIFDNQQEDQQSGFIMSLDSSEESLSLKKCTRGRMAKYMQQPHKQADGSSYQCRSSQIQENQINQKPVKSQRKAKQSNGMQSRQQISFFDSKQMESIQEQKDQMLATMSKLKADDQSHSNIHTHESSQVGLNINRNINQMMDLSKLPNLLENFNELDQQSQPWKDVKMEQYDFMDGFQESGFGFTGYLQRDGGISNLFQFNSNRFHL